MKPKLRKLTAARAYWTFYCHGHHPDGQYSYGFGHTMEQAYQGWLDYDHSEIDF